jgi:hypothetical protein
MIFDRLVEGVRRDLNAANERHGAEGGEEPGGRRGSDGAGGRVDIVGGEGEGGLHGERFRYFLPNLTPQ